MNATPRNITQTAVAKALAHPLRGRILAALDQRTASPSELALELDAPLGVASYHVRRLSTLGLVKLVRRVPRRGAVEHYYTAVPLPAAEVDGWHPVPSSIRRSAIGDELQRLGTSVTAAAAAGGFDRPGARLTHTALSLDDQGWREATDELDRLVRRLTAIQANSDRRTTAAHRAGSDGASAPTGAHRSSSDGNSAPAGADRFGSDGASAPAGAHRPASDGASVPEDGPGTARQASAVIMLFETGSAARVDGATDEEAVPATATRGDPASVG